MPQTPNLNKLRMISGRDSSTVTTPYSDVTGFEAFHQPLELGHTDTSFREAR